MIIVENNDLFDRFTEIDLDLVSAFANQAAAAIENARLYHGLEQRVAERTAQLKASNARLEQNNAELAIVNSVQEGLAAELNFRAIVDMVGEKLRQVFDTGDIGIRWYDPEANLLHYLYEYEHGVRLSIPSSTPSNTSVWATVIHTRQPVILNTRAEMAALGIQLVPGTDQSKSMISVPIVGRDRVVGNILLENYEKEHAYSEVDVRLLGTVAASMGVALENARLFDEAQQRAREMAVLAEVGRGFPQGSLVLVGPVLDHDSASSLATLPNVRMIGPKPRCSNPGCCGRGPAASPPSTTRTCTTAPTPAGW
jgi:GAF domain-containing protein